MQKTRQRTLKPGAKFTDATGERRGGGDVVHLTLSQEWFFRDKLVPTGSDPDHEPTPKEIAANEGRETIAVGTAPAAPQAVAVPQAPAQAPAPAAGPPADAQVPATPAPEEGPHPIHDLNVAEAQELVASAGTAAALDVLAAAELRHPRHAGGRLGVNRAVEARRAELTE